MIYKKIFQNIFGVKNILKVKKITRCIKIQPSSSKIESRRKKLVKSCDLEWVKVKSSEQNAWVSSKNLFDPITCASGVAFAGVIDLEIGSEISPGSWRSR